MENYAQLLLNSTACGVLSYPPKMLKANSFLLYDTASLYQSLVRNGRVCETTNVADSLATKDEVRSESPSSTSEGQQDGRRYAGPKFAHAPLPGDLPKPPSHWMAKNVQSDASKAHNSVIKKTSSGLSTQAKGKYKSPEHTVDIEELTSHLKQLLKVQIS